MNKGKREKINKKTVAHAKEVRRLYNTGEKTAIEINLRKYKN